MRVIIHWIDSEDPSEYDCERVTIQEGVLILHGAEGGHWTRMCHPIRRIDWWGEEG